MVGLVGCLLVVAFTWGFAGQMAENAIRTDLAHIAVHVRGYHANPDVGRVLPDAGREVLAIVDRLDGAAASPRLRGEGLVRTSRNNARGVIVGVDPERERRVSIISSALVEGTYLDGEWSGRLPPVVIGQAMAEPIALEYQSPGNAVGTPRKCPFRSSQR